MAYTANFAGTNLHDYFKIERIQRSILPQRTNFTKSIPSVDGEVYTGYKYNPKKITLKCAMYIEDSEDRMDKLRQIAFRLDVKNPSKLILGDDPYVYNYAILEGDSNLDIVKNIKGEFELNFICYDPKSYSIEEDLFDSNASKKIEVLNSGTTDAFPKIQAIFSKETFFFKCSDEIGRTVLVGTPENIDKKQAPMSPIVLKDNCETLEGWTGIGNVIDAGREVNGNLVINGGGYGITLGNAGSNAEGWHGGGLRKNLEQELTDFRVEVKLEHNSWGDVNGTGAGTDLPITEGGKWVEYKITAEPSLRIRAGRGTNTAKIGSYKKGAIVKVTDIQKNWGYIGKINGKDGYISMEFATIHKATTTDTSSAFYKITPRIGLNIRAGRGTNYKRVTAIPHGEVVAIRDVQNGWGKTSYNGKNGYVAMQYVSKTSSNRTTGMSTGSQIRTTGDGEIVKPPSAESKIGRIEIYGYDKEGNKLFKMEMKDTEKYYEYSEPSVEFGSQLVLDDGFKCPNPNTITEKSNDEKTVTKQVDSGKFGTWNEFIGNFYIERRTVNGKQQWYTRVQKTDASGIVVKSIETQKLMGHYPTGSLNNIVIFIGGYKSEPLVEAMSINDISVTNLANPPKPEVQTPAFKANDRLLIDSQTQKVYLNGSPIMSKVDIGSQFFTCPVGDSTIDCGSDDENVDIDMGMQKRWL